MAEQRLSRDFISTKEEHVTPDMAHLSVEASLTLHWLPTPTLDYEERRLTEPKNYGKPLCSGFETDCTHRSATVTRLSRLSRGAVNSRRSRRSLEPQKHSAPQKKISTPETLAIALALV